MVKPKFDRRAAEKAAIEAIAKSESVPSTRRGMNAAIARHVSAAKEAFDASNPGKMTKVTETNIRWDYMHGYRTTWDEVFTTILPEMRRCYDCQVTRIVD